MLGLTKKPQVSLKDQILRGVYEENLVVVGKKKPEPPFQRIIDEQRKKAIAKANQRHPSFYFLLLIISAAVAYAAMITFWSFPYSVFQGGESNVATANFAQNNFPQDDSIKKSIPSVTTSPSDAKPSGEMQLTNVEPDDSAKPATIDDVIYGVYMQPKPTSPTEHATPEAIAQLKTLASPNVPPLAKLFGLGVRTIVIDPGHGGKDPGATGHLGTHEKDITLTIAKRLRDRLKAYENYKVLMTRETDESLSLNERVKFANENQADIFISIHINYFPSDKINFVETYYFGPNTDRKVAELAAKENADSQYLYAEFKGMVEKIGDTMKFQESKDLAQSVQEILYPQIRKVNKKAQNHGIKPGPFVVLLGIDAPSILTEVTSLNNKQEEKRLKSPAYRDKIATFLEKGIVNYLNKSTNNPGGERNGNGEEKENLAQAQDN